MTASDTGLRSLLTIPDFRRLWSAQVISDFGDNLTFITILFLVQRLTGSTVAIATVTIAITIPSLLFGVLSGVYVDRLDRKRVMVVSDLVRAMVVLGLVLVRDESMVWLIYVIAFAQGAVGTMFNPARGALLPHIVGQERLLAANSVSQTSRIIFNLAGTAVAGILAGMLNDLSPAFIIDATTFAVSALLVAGIRTESDPSADGTPRSSVRHDLTAGFKVIATSRGLIGILLAGGVAMLGLGAVNVLMVPFVVDDLAISESWFGLLEAGQVGGMVLSGVLIAVLANRFRPPALISTGMVVIGGLIAAVSRVDGVVSFIFVLFGVGLFMTPLQSSVATLSQTLIPDELRGRVGAALNTLISVANVTSMGFAGVLAAAVGVRPVFVIAGAITVLAGVASWLVFRGAPDAHAQPVPATPVV